MMDIKFTSYLDWFYTALFALFRTMKIPLLR